MLSFFVSCSTIGIAKQQGGQQMTIHRYYALIEPTEEENYLVTFPDLENVFTDGETLPHAIEMAEDCLGLMLTDYEDEGNVIPPSPAKTIEVPEGASLVLIEVDTDNFREAV